MKPETGPAANHVGAMLSSVLRSLTPSLMGALRADPAQITLRLMDDDWLTAKVARDLIRLHVSPTPTSLICNRAHDGLIEARARRLILGTKIIDDASVPKDFWWAHGQHALEQDWGSGDFSTWLDGKHHLRAYGVEFRRRDIEAMLPRSGAPSFRSVAQGNYASAAHCMTELCNVLAYSEAEVEQLLIHHCKLGALPSRSTRMIVTTRTLYGDDDTDEYECAEIPEAFWEHCASGSEAILDWGLGRFIGRGIVNEYLTHYRLEGVQFEVAAIVDLERAERRRKKAGLIESSENGTGVPRADDRLPERPRLPEAMLQRWWASKANVRDSLSLEELLALAEHAHPDHAITRDRIRKIAGPRKRGPKRIGGKSVAE